MSNFEEYEGDIDFKVRRATQCANENCNRALCKDKTRTVNFCCLICEKRHFGIWHSTQKHGGMCSRDTLDWEAPRALPKCIADASGDYPYSGYRANQRSSRNPPRTRTRGDTDNSRGDTVNSRGDTDSSRNPPRTVAVTPPKWKQDHQDAPGVPSAHDHDRLWDISKSTFSHQELQRNFLNYSWKAYRAQYALQFPANKDGMKQFVTAWIDDTMGRFSQGSEKKHLLKFDDAKAFFVECLAAGLGPKEKIVPPPRTWPHTGKELKAAFEKFGLAAPVVKTETPANSVGARRSEGDRSRSSRRTGRDRSRSQRRTGRDRSPSLRTRPDRSRSPKPSTPSTSRKQNGGRLIDQMLSPDAGPSVTGTAKARRRTAASPLSGDESEVGAGEEHGQIEEEEEVDFEEPEELKEAVSEEPQEEVEEEEQDNMQEDESVNGRSPEYDEQEVSLDHEREGQAVVVSDDDGGPPESDVRTEGSIRSIAARGNPKCDSGDTCQGSPDGPVGPLTSRKYDGKYCSQCREILEMEF